MFHVLMFTTYWSIIIQIKKNVCQSLPVTPFQTHFRFGTPTLHDQIKILKDKINPHPLYLFNNIFVFWLWNAPVYKSKTGCKSAFFSPRDNFPAPLSEVPSVPLGWACICLLPFQNTYERSWWASAWRFPSWSLVLWTCCKVVKKVEG